MRREEDPEKKIPGLKIEIVQESSAKGRLLQGINEAGSVGVLYAGVILSLLSMFAVPQQVWAAAVAGLAVLVLLLAGGRLKKVGYVLCGLLFAVFLAVVLLKQTPVYQGLLLVCNDALGQLGHHLGVMKDAFEVTAAEASYLLCYLLFVGIFSVFLALICHSVAESRNNYLMFLLLLPLLVLQMVFGVKESSWPLIVLLLGVILCIAGNGAQGTKNRKKCGDFEECGAGPNACAAYGDLYCGTVCTAGRTAGGFLSDSRLCHRSQGKDPQHIR